MGFATQELSAIDRVPGNIAGIEYDTSTRPRAEPAKRTSDIPFVASMLTTGLSRENPYGTAIMVNATPPISALVDEINQMRVDATKPISVDNPQTQRSPRKGAFLVAGAALTTLPIVAVTTGCALDAGTITGISIKGYPIKSDMIQPLVQAGQECPDYTIPIAASQALRESSDGQNNGPVTASDGTTHEGPAMFDPKSDLWKQVSQGTNIDINSPWSVVLMAKTICGFEKRHGWPLGTALNAYFAGETYPSRGGNYGSTIIDNANTVVIARSANADENKNSGSGANNNGSSVGANGRLPENHSDTGLVFPHEVDFWSGANQFAFNRLGPNRWNYDGVNFRTRHGRGKFTDPAGQKVVFTFNENAASIDVR